MNTILLFVILGLCVAVSARKHHNKHDNNDDKTPEENQRGRSAVTPTKKPKYDPKVLKRLSNQAKSSEQTLGGVLSDDDAKKEFERVLKTNKKLIAEVTGKAREVEGVPEGIIFKDIIVLGADAPTESGQGLTYEVRIKMTRIIFHLTILKNKKNVYSVVDIELKPHV